jgi:hypothetical protein
VRYTGVLSWASFRRRSFRLESSSHSLGFQESIDMLVLTFLPSKLSSMQATYQKIMVDD